MKTNYTYDFKSRPIKEMIEKEFYMNASKYLRKNSTTTIITGPDYERHVDNFNKYINSTKLRICETNPLIFSDIYKGLLHNEDIKVINKSIEHFGSSFIDADLTCVSDVDVIRKTLMKQIDIQSNNVSKNKVFIFSFSPRTKNKKKLLTSHLRCIFGLLGASIVSIRKETSLVCLDSTQYIRECKLAMTKGRIIDYTLYKYNAGGGPMVTCQIIYK